MAQTIALVDDDKNILTSLSMALEAEGFIVDMYSDGDEAFSGLSIKPADIVILDIKMPRMNGMELLNRLRQKSNIPIIFLTSKDDEIDEVLGLRLGADDYITKPFSQRLLIERVRVVLRREDNKNNPNENSSSIIKRSGLKLDPEKHLCTWHEQEVVLTVTEFLIVQALAQRPGHVKSRDQLMDTAYGDNIYVDDRTIDSHIKRLRKKFKKVDASFSQIETLYGIGYRYKED